MENFNLEKNKISYLILFSLLDKDNYANEIISKIQFQTNNKIQLKQSTLYSNLNKLEKVGLINSYWNVNENNDKCHYYSITDLGKKEIAAFDKKSIEEIVLKEKTLNNTSPLNEYSINEKKENALKRSTENNEFVIPKQTNIFETQNEKNLYKTFDIENEFQNINTEVKSFSNYSSPKKFHEEEIKKEKNILEENTNQNNEQESTEQKVESFENDDGVFIQERIPEEKRPKVHKLDSTHLDKFLDQKNNFNNQSLKNSKNKFSTDKIDNLYKNSQINKLNKDELNFQKLEEKYKNIDINFQVYKQNNENKPVKTKNPNKFLNVKLFIILMFICIESLLFYIFFPQNNIINIIYLLFPVLTLIIFIINLIKHNKTIKIKAFVFYLLTFLVGLLLILGIYLLTSINYLICIYLFIIWINALINGICNCLYIKKSD